MSLEHLIALSEELDNRGIAHSVKPAEGIRPGRVVIEGYPAIYATIGQCPTCRQMRADGYVWNGAEHHTSAGQMGLLIALEVQAAQIVDRR